MDVRYLVIHCADTPNEREVTAAEIHSWHLANGWDGIGYHKVVGRSGLVENGRPEYWTGSHVRGKNSSSLGVCLIGKDSFTEEQWESLYAVLSDWKKKYPDAKVVGHYQLDSRKSCPNFDVGHYVKSMGLI